jgi:hypothetical protein
MPMMLSNVKIVVFVPESHADRVRDAIGKVDAGKFGRYTFCSFSSKGVGRFKPQKGAHPTIGKIGKLETVNEERIEVTCTRESLERVVEAIKKVHPYEEIVIDIYPMEKFKSYPHSRA